MSNTNAQNTNNPRQRDRLRSSASATAPAQLPAIADVQLQDPQLQNVLQAIRERLEVREGSRGNPHEAVVTHRDLQHMGLTQTPGLDQLPPKTDGIVVLGPEGGYRVMGPDEFADAIRNSKLYQDLVKSLDDPTRFDGLVQEVKTILLSSLAEEAARRGAEISRVEHTTQNDLKSLAYTLDTVTASVESAQAGIRTIQYASAEVNRAQAGKITQLEASLGNYYQDGQPGRARLEEQMTATADRVTGLDAQYTLKVQAGKKIAGIGLAATEPLVGPSTSAFMVMADKFAVVMPDTVVPNPASPPLSTIPFGVDSSGVYIKGQLRVDASGSTLAQVSTDSKIRGSVTRVVDGSYWSDYSATYAVCQTLGKNTDTTWLRLGDTVTIRNGAGFAETRHWNGYNWALNGVTINGNMLVSGSVTADQFSSQALQTINAQISQAEIGTAQIRNARIQGAQIDNLLVDTLQIKGNAVTVPVSSNTQDGGLPYASFKFSHPGNIYVLAVVNFGNAYTSGRTASMYLRLQSNLTTFDFGYVAISVYGGYGYSLISPFILNDQPAGNYTISVQSVDATDPKIRVHSGNLMIIGAMR